jgi:hypothetical protein
MSAVPSFLLGGTALSLFLILCVDRWEKFALCPQTQGCKLLSDIGQCPTKFGKCPSKSNFDRTLVRSHKKIVTLYIFLLWQNPIANSLNLYFAINFTRRSSIYFYLTLRRNGIHTCLVTYIYLVTCICPTKFSDVGFCLTKFKLCPTKIKSDLLSCQVKYLFAALQVSHRDTVV